MLYSSEEPQELLVLRKFLSNRIREDGRSFEERLHRNHNNYLSFHIVILYDSRQWKIHRRPYLQRLPNSNNVFLGSSQVHCGNTMLACGVKLLVGTTSALFPDHGDVGMFTQIICSSVS